MKNFIKIFIAYIIVASVFLSSVFANNFSVQVFGVPTAQYVPFNAENIKIVTIKTSSQDDMELWGFEISEDGLWELMFLKNLQIQYNNQIIPANIFASQEWRQLVVKFDSPIHIKKWQAQEFDILVSIDVTKRNEERFQFSLTGYLKQEFCKEKITPVTLGLLNVTSFRAGEVWYKGLEYRDGSEYKYKIQLFSTHDSILKNIKLDSTLNLNENFSEFALYSNNKKLQPNISVSANGLYLWDLNYGLNKGDGIELELVAKIRDWKILWNEEIFTISHPSDLSIFEEGSGIMMRIADYDQVVEDFKLSEEQNADLNLNFQEKKFDVCHLNSSSGNSSAGGGDWVTSSSTSTTVISIPPTTWSTGSGGGSVGSDSGASTSTTTSATWVNAGGGGGISSSSSTNVAYPTVLAPYRGSNSGPGGGISRVMYVMTGGIPRKVELSETWKILKKEDEEFINFRSKIIERLSSLSDIEIQILQKFFANF